MPYHLVWTYDSAQPTIEVFQDPHVLAVERVTSRTIYVVMAEGIATSPTSVGDEPMQCHVRLIEGNTKTDIFDMSVMTLVRDRFENLAQPHGAVDESSLPFTTRATADTPYWFERSEAEDGHIGAYNGLVPPGSRGSLFERLGSVALVDLEGEVQHVYVRTADLVFPPVMYDFARVTSSSAVAWPENGYSRHVPEGTVVQVLDDSGPALFRVTLPDGTEAAINPDNLSPIWLSPIWHDSNPNIPRRLVTLINSSGPVPLWTSRRALEDGENASHTVPSGTEALFTEAVVIGLPGVINPATIEMPNGTFFTDTRYLESLRASVGLQGTLQCDQPDSYAWLVRAAYIASRPADVRIPNGTKVRLVEAAAAHGTPATCIDENCRTLYVTPRHFVPDKDVATTLHNPLGRVQLWYDQAAFEASRPPEDSVPSGTTAVRLSENAVIVYGRIAYTNTQEPTSPPSRYDLLAKD